MFVLSEGPFAFAKRLRALDLETGRMLWERFVSMIDGRVAAGEDTVVVSSEGFQAFDAATGETRWVSRRRRERRPGSWRRSSTTGCC